MRAEEALSAEEAVSEMFADIREVDLSLAALWYAAVIVSEMVACSSSVCGKVYEAWLRWLMTMLVTRIS